MTLQQPSPEQLCPKHAACQQILFHGECQLPDNIDSEHLHTIPSQCSALAQKTLDEVKKIRAETKQLPQALNELWHNMFRIIKSIRDCPIHSHCANNSPNMQENVSR